MMVRPNFLPFARRYTTSELLPVNTDRASYLGENLKVFQGLDVLNGGEEACKLCQSRFRQS
jgi:hypothetical protein